MEVITLAEIDKDFTKKRNKELLKEKDLCCGWGKKTLEDIEQVTEINDSDVAFAPFIEHAPDCHSCLKVLTDANKKTRNEMEY